MKGENIGCLLFLPRFVSQTKSPVIPPLSTPHFLALKTKTAVLTNRNIRKIYKRTVSNLKFDFIIWQFVLAFMTCVLKKTNSHYTCPSIFLIKMKCNSEAACSNHTNFIIIKRKNWKTCYWEFLHVSYQYVNYWKFSRQPIIRSLDCQLTVIMLCHQVKMISLPMFSSPLNRPQWQIRYLLEY